MRTDNHRAHGSPGGSASAPPADPGRKSKPSPRPPNTARGRQTTSKESVSFATEATKIPHTPMTAPRICRPAPRSPAQSPLLPHRSLPDHPPQRVHHLLCVESSTNILRRLPRSKGPARMTVENIDTLARADGRGEVPQAFNAVRAPPKKPSAPGPNPSSPLPPVIKSPDPLRPSPPRSIMNLVGKRPPSFHRLRGNRKETLGRRARWGLGKVGKGGGGEREMRGGEKRRKQRS